MIYSVIIHFFLQIHQSLFKLIVPYAGKICPEGLFFLLDSRHFRLADLSWNIISILQIEDQRLDLQIRVLGVYPLENETLIHLEALDPSGMIEGYTHAVAVHVLRPAMIGQSFVTDDIPPVPVYLYKRTMLGGGVVKKSGYDIFSFFHLISPAYRQ